MQTLKFRFYCNRWRAEDTYDLEWLSDGWHIRHSSIFGLCQPNGEPYLYANFRHDNVSYPSSIGDFLEWLWEQIRDNNISEEQAQARLQELADWVTACEQAQPQWPEWNA